MPKTHVFRDTISFMKKNNLFFAGNIPVDLLAIIIGILFLIHSNASWKVLYILTVVFFFYTPAAMIINLLHHDKQKTKLDTFLIIFDFLFAIYILSVPAKFMSFVYVFVGWWIVAHGLISFINFYVCLQDRLKGAPQKLFNGIFSILLGTFLIWSPNMGSKSWLLAAAAGVYFCFYGGISLLTHLNLAKKEYGRKHTAVTVSLPVILNAFLPLRAYVSIHHLLQDSNGLPLKAEEPHDLEVYLYLNGHGPESFGHLDIAYKGTIYSYGCHDPQNRKLMGTLGDGVLIQSDQRKFLQNALDGEKKIVVGYGIRLNDTDRQKLEKRIAEMMARTVPWKCLAEIAEEKHEDDSQIHDYASRVYKHTHAKMFKFSQGKFRTYFVGSTNCVLLADELIRNPDLRLIDLNGFVTPGAYLSFLNTQYIAKGTAVISRSVYQFGIRNLPDSVS